MCIRDRLCICKGFSGCAAMLEKRRRRCQLVLVLSTLSVRASVIAVSYTHLDVYKRQVLVKVRPGCRFVHVL